MGRRIVGIILGIFVFSIPAIAAPAGDREFSPSALIPLAGDEDTRPLVIKSARSVEFRTDHSPGTILISTSKRELHFVTGNGNAIRYKIAVGKEGFSWSGQEKITRMAMWPDWRPPAEMRKRRPDLPALVEGGPNNPMGARALYLGSTLYRIHGSNEPNTIGQAVSSGCIRLSNEDVIDLYARASLGSTVIVAP